MNIAIYFKAQDISVGGGFTYQNQLLKALIKNAPNTKHNYYIYHLSNCGSQQLNMNIWSYPLFNTKGEELKSKLIIEHDIQFVWNLLPASILTYDIPYAITIWDLQHRRQPFFPEVSSGHEWKAREEFYSYATKRAAYIVTGTEIGKEEISFYCGVMPERIRVIPFAAPHCEDETIDIRSKYNLTKPYLFYPAQFWPHKNHVNLIKSISILQDNFGVNVDLVFTGSDKGNLGYIRSMVDKLNLTNSIHFLGFVPANDISALYKCSEALLYGSFFGPDNLPPLEAFAYGCPVVTADVPGAREQLGDAAIFVNPSDPMHIAFAIRKVLSDMNLRKNMIRKGIEKAKSWTWDQYTAQVFAMFDDFSSIRDTWL